MFYMHELTHIIRLPKTCVFLPLPSARKIAFIFERERAKKGVAVNIRCDLIVIIACML